MDIIISDDIKAAAPALTVVTIEADVANSPTPDPLWTLIGRTCASLRECTPLADVAKRPAIAATRRAYKALGKEPNRYRPAAEALTRRAVKDMELYRIDTLVDLINLLSLMSGYSIGGFDAAKIDGPALTLGVGREGEPYEAIGRGQLNIASMPVYRDLTGGVGTHTSDNVRTCIDASTTRLLMCINVYGEEMPIDQTVDTALWLLETYASAANIKVNYHHA